MKITVVDSIMGSGKTMKAINMMNEGSGSFIYITPFLTEVERIKKSVTNKVFFEPKNYGKGKLSSFKNLIKQGKNIASTHALFSTADDELMELIKLNGYTLILDEVMEVIEQVPISKDDLNMLINDERIFIEEDGKVIWNNEKEYTGDFEDIRIMAEHDRLIMANTSLMLWTFPVDAFKCFEDVYILTYMFKGQIMKYYYDLYNIKYEYVSVRKIEDNFEFTEFNDGKSSIVNLIKILEDNRLNKIGEDRYSLSYGWYEKSKDSYLEILKRNLTNFFRNKNKAKSNEILWTTFKGGAEEKYRKALQNDGFRSKKCFAPMNSRATNSYSNRKYVAYTVNRYINPYLKNFFKKKGVEVHEDEYALSEMLQFIFRSSIRKGEEIIIYIPSRRMRELLNDWIKKGEKK